jgi:hypothetical protein
LDEAREKQAAGREDTPHFLTGNRGFLLTVRDNPSVVQPEALIEATCMRISSEQKLFTKSCHQVPWNYIGSLSSQSRNIENSSGAE